LGAYQACYLQTQNNEYQAHTNRDMNGSIIFEIPVYRLSPSAHERETNKLLKEYTTPDKKFLVDTGVWDSLSDAQKREQIESWRAFFYRSRDSRIWRYNDIIGYIILFANPNQIKAEYFWIDAKRISRELVNKIFRYRDKAFELWVDDQDTSESISKGIRDKLVRLSKEPRFKGRHIDSETFDNISPFVDWKSITRPK